MCDKKSSISFVLKEPLIHTAGCWGGGGGIEWGGGAHNNNDTKTGLLFLVVMQASDTAVVVVSLQLWAPILNAFINLYGAVHKLCNAIGAYRLGQRGITEGREGQRLLLLPSNVTKVGNPCPLVA